MRVSIVDSLKIGVEIDAIHIGTSFDTRYKFTDNNYGKGKYVCIFILGWDISIA